MMSPITTPIRRRRFIAIAAAAAGLPLSLSRGSVAHATPLRIWTGSALGADAMLQIQHPDPATADRLIAMSLAEVARLERVFSLYRPDSALVQLNRHGSLENPPTDLVRLLSASAQFNALTGGAFDATVQPLWAVYAARRLTPAGPSPADLAAALASVGHDGVEIAPRRIRFIRPGMAVTLNGIAQGYITDRVVERLKDAGMAHALVDMGETRAIGGHPDGSAWQVGLADPGNPVRPFDRIPLLDQAVATSGGYGTPLDPAGRFNHIFDPASGRTSWRFRSVSVIAADATTADALSTAFSVMPLERSQSVIDQLGVRAVFLDDDGVRRTQQARLRPSGA